MGLAGTKTRRKLAHDPNNTKWSRNEKTFGQKILRAQGWEPGKFLGAQDASHTDLHTAASSAPIKVVVKDDNLGLGAKIRQKQSTECTGLDGFKDLLGRLNGKSEDAIDKERKLRNDIKTSLYIERRFGTMRFVSGGLLIGDQIKDLVKTDPATLESRVTERSPSESTTDEQGPWESKKAKKEKKSKKRKAEETESADVSDTTREKKRKKSSKKDDAREESDIPEPKDSTKERKKSKKSKKSKDRDEGEDDGSKPKKRKDKKSKSSKDKSSSTPEGDTEQLTLAVSEDSASQEREEKKRRKKEKKEKKRLEKENAAAGATSTSNPSPSSATPAESGTSTPTGTGTSTPQAAANRHHVRGRYIASKRLALADMQALNQIFMIKAV